MNHTRLFNTATLLADGQVLVAGGGESSATAGSAELYDPAGSMPVGFECAESATLMPNGLVLAICFADASLYNPSSGTWSPTAQQPPGAANGVMGVLPDGQVWSSGGVLYTPSTSQWTPYSTPAPCLRCHIGGEVLLADGKALAAGGEQGTFGYSSFNTIKNAHLFDPSTLTWTSTGTMVFSSEGQTMTLLSNGQVLSAGGESFNKAMNRLVPITDAQIYTP